MAKITGAKCQASIVAESVWGTDPGTGATNIALCQESDLNLGELRTLSELRCGHTYPLPTSTYNVGQTVEPSWTTIVVPEIKGFISDMAVRTTDLLPSYTIKKLWASSGSTFPGFAASGCKCSSLTLTSDNTGGSPFVMAEISFVGQSTAIASPAELVPTPTKPFLCAETTLSIGGSAVTGFDSVKLTITNELITCGVGSGGLISDLKEGEQNAEVEIVLPMTGKTYANEAIAAAIADTGIVVVFANGTATGSSTLTYTAATCKLITPNPINNAAVNEIEKYTLTYRTFGTWTLVDA